MAVTVIAKIQQQAGAWKIIDVVDLEPDTDTDGYVLTGDGSGNVAMEAASEHAHANDHAQAHGPTDHTGFANWKLIYTDGSGDQQEIALGADGTVLTGTSATGAPAFEAASGHAHANDHPQVHGVADHTEHANWKLFYSDGSGDETEIALGADGTVLTGTSATGAPAFEAADEHAHTNDHAEAHGIAAHTGHANWKLLYTDGSGDEQEIALGADGTVLTGTSATGAPAFEAASGHAHANDHAQAHGPSQHTEGTAWRLVYQDASGDEQEIALGADGTVFTGTSTTGAPAFEAADQHSHVSQGSITTVGALASGSLAAGFTDVPIAQGGTGQSSQTAAFDALGPGTTKGDVIIHNGSDHIRVAVGTNDHVLTADSGEASGVKWAAGGGGGTSHAMVGAYYPGVLSTGIKSTPQRTYLGDGFTATKFQCRVAVVPAGATITVQLKRGVGEGASANLGGVATIAIGNHLSDVVVLNQAIASADFFEINITQTGTNPNQGSDLDWGVAP